MIASHILKQCRGEGAVQCNLTIICAVQTNREINVA